MYVLQLTERNESFQVELWDRVMNTRTKVSLAYVRLELAQEIFDRIPTFEAARLWKVMTTNYAAYAHRPKAVHAWRPINLPTPPQLTETANHEPPTPQTGTGH